MKQKKRRIFAILCVLCMLFTSMPASVYADITPATPTDLEPAEPAETEEPEEPEEPEETDEPEEPGEPEYDKPPVDRAVTHGDFCLPNLFSDGKGFTGFIDVGNTGVADRWTDLALGWRSLKHNSDGHYGKTYPNVDPYDLFRAAGVSADEEKLRYYLLLDELN